MCVHVHVSTFLMHFCLSFSALLCQRTLYLLLTTLPELLLAQL